jgi:asparagine synthase (glutamine-hydrolysing)
MCGFAGYLNRSSSQDQLAEEAMLKRMTDSISYRGPDDSGYWCDRDRGIGLGHRRLSVVDLSIEGHQPMQSPSGRYVIAFNGEIYNYNDLQKRLSSEIEGGVRWRGHSDTEVLLAGFDVWGIQGTVERAVGMFAFAVWDKHENTLTLGRDRIGEKPLYYGWQGNSFLFASELKALKRHREFKAEVDRRSICLLMRHNCIPAPYSIYAGIQKLMPGCLLSISLARPEPKIWSYWSAIETVKSGVNSPFSGTPDEAIDELERLIKNAIKRQMMADVPLGAFLSGGVDSSTVVALMQAQASKPVNTFTIGFNEEGYNEAVHAKAVAMHLKTNHRELYVSPEAAMRVIPDLPVLFDEPFSDSSQIPTFLVSQLARQHVTVALSGDAGDELFCGYNRYELTAKLWQKLAILPQPVKQGVAKGITMFSPQSWDRLCGYIPGPSQFRNIGDKLHKGAGVITARSADELYLGLVSHYSNPSGFVIGGREPGTLLTGSKPNLDGLSDVQRMMALDLITYLPDDILTKVDRAAMGVSLETRMPFLDHRIVEFAWSLPQSMKLRHGETKWPLRQILYRYVRRELIERPKMGFGVPLHDWLRGPLKDWSEGLLDENRIKREGFFYPAPLRMLWKEHLSGRRNWAYRLWNVLMFQAWLENQ